jgi:hypothetical protein
MEGRRYRVEADARGRIVRVATFIGPSKVAEIRYRFAGAGPDANGYDAWAADGEPTRSRWYPGDVSTTYYDTEFDERTGLVTGRRKYRHGALDSSLEVRFAHDAKRRTREARYAYNERHVCTLVYERLANGRVVRSLAVGPDGQVWAEYPDLYVEYIERTGEAVDRPGVAKIYRKGPWWPGPGDRWVDAGSWPDPARRQPLGARDRALFSVHPLIVVAG